MPKPKSMCLFHPLTIVVTKFAATKSYSKDRGVRLNKAFSYLAHDRTGGAYDRYALGTFAQRTKVPSNATIEYKMDCSAKRSKSTPKEKPIQTAMVLAWSALDATMLPYDDAPSYRRQFCSQDSIQTVKKFVFDSANADDFKSVKTELHYGHKKSRELYRGSYASFHMLSDGITAVFRLGTESPNKQGNYKTEFYKNIGNGFAAMEAAGAKKLIIDLQNNSGGIICWGRYVLQTLFPNTVDSPYIYSLRASPLAQVLAKATFLYKQDVASPYGGLVDPATDEEVTDDSWMNPGNKLQGREGTFSKKVADRFCSAVDEIKGAADEALFEPEDILILTNGYCGIDMCGSGVAASRTLWSADSRCWWSSRTVYGVHILPRRRCSSQQHSLDPACPKGVQFHADPCPDPTAQVSSATVPPCQRSTVIHFPPDHECKRRESGVRVHAYPE